MGGQRAPWWEDAGERARRCFSLAGKTPKDTHTHTHLPLRKSARLAGKPKGAPPFVKLVEQVKNISGQRFVAETNRGKSPKASEGLGKAGKAKRAPSIGLLFLDRVRKGERLRGELIVERLGFLGFGLAADWFGTGPSERFCLTRERWGISGLLEVIVGRSSCRRSGFSFGLAADRL